MNYHLINSMNKLNLKYTIVSEDYVLIHSGKASISDILLDASKDFIHLVGEAFSDSDTVFSAELANTLNGYLIAWTGSIGMWHYFTEEDGNVCGLRYISSAPKSILQYEDILREWLHLSLEAHASTYDKTDGEKEV